MSLEQHAVDEQSPSSPWVTAAAGKVAFYSQRDVSIDMATCCTIALMLLLTSQGSLCDGMSAWDDSGKLWSFQPVALPFLMWSCLCALLVLPGLGSGLEWIPLTTHAQPSAGFVLFGLLDAVSQLITSFEGARFLPSSVRMALSCVELVCVDLFAWRFFQEQLNARAFIATAALSILCFLVADYVEDGDADLYEQEAADLTTRFSTPVACMSLVLAAVCRAVRLSLGSALLRQTSRRLIPAVSDARNSTKAAILAGLSGSSLAVVVAFSTEGIPPMPTSFCAACGAVLLCVAPVIVATTMIALQQGLTFTVAILEVSHSLLSAVLAAFFSHEHITRGQLLALVLVLAGASWTFGRQVFGFAPTARVTA